MSKDKNDGNGASDAQPEPSFDDLSGAILIAKWGSEKDRDQMMIKAENGFGPFLLTTFDTEGSAHFKMFGAETISPWMMGILGEHLITVSRFNRTLRLQAAMQQKQSSGIIVPGMKVPPNLDAKTS